MVAAEAGQQRADNLGARRQLAQSSLASGLLYPLLANLGGNHVGSLGLQSF